MFFVEMLALKLVAPLVAWHLTPCGEDSSGYSCTHFSWERGNLSVCGMSTPTPKQGYFEL